MVNSIEYMYMILSVTYGSNRWGFQMTGYGKPNVAKFNGNSMTIQWQFNGNSTNIQWQFNDHSMPIQRTFNGNSMIIQWQFNDHSMAIQ